MKKIIIIVIVIVIVIVIGLVFYFGLRQTTSDRLPIAATPTPETPIIPVVTNLAEAAPLEAKTYYKEITKNSVELPSQLKNLLDVTVHPYKKDQLIIIEKPSGLLETTAWIYHQKDKTLAPFFEGVVGLSLNWSADGEQILKFQIEPKARQPNLILINQTTGLELELPWVTFPEKCLIEKEVLYCALPLELPANLTLPDDYLKRKFYSQDRLVKLTLKNSSIETLDDGLNQLIDAVDLKLIENNLYFTNRRDNKVYKIKL